VEPGIFSDFKSAGEAILEVLYSRLPFDLWMITRVQDDDWIVLVAEDHGYNVEPGTIFKWSESFCHHMVKGDLPLIAPQSDIVLPYASALIGRKIKIGAYIGMPLVNPDGSLFGTLCAIHPSPLPPAIVEEEPLVRVFAALLSTLLAREPRPAVAGGLHRE
jgi:diguanylate cyclase